MLCTCAAQGCSSLAEVGTPCSLTLALCAVGMHAPSWAAPLVHLRAQVVSPLAERVHPGCSRTLHCVEAHFQDSPLGPRRRHRKRLGKLGRRQEQRVWPCPVCLPCHSARTRPCPHGSSLSSSSSAMTRGSQLQPSAVCLPCHSARTRPLLLAAVASDGRHVAASPSGTQCTCPGPHSTRANSLSWATDPSWAPSPGGPPLGAPHCAAATGPSPGTAGPRTESYCICVLYLCTVSVHCICVLYLCTVYCICALYLCTVSVYCICALYLCTVSVYCVLYLSPYLLMGMSRSAT